MKASLIISILAFALSLGSLGLGVGMTLYYWHFMGGAKRVHVEWTELKRALR